MNNIDNFNILDSKIFTLNYIEYLTKVLNGIEPNQIESFVECLLETREKDGTIYFIGNGGSAATASHFVNDLSVGLSNKGKPFKAICLSDNVPSITAIGNDESFDLIFLNQVKAFLTKKDLLVAISASGNSLNLVNCFEYAINQNIQTFSITAFDGGRLKEISNKYIHIKTNKGEYGPAEDAHMIIDHLVTSFLSRYI